MEHAQRVTDRSGEPSHVATAAGRVSQEGNCYAKRIPIASLPLLAARPDRVLRPRGHYPLHWYSDSVPFHASASTRPNPATQLCAGSEWLYLKLYTGALTADKLLGTSVKELTELLLAQGLIDRWFFVRYADPDPHLRLRFHQGSATTDRFYAELLPTVYRWADKLQQAGLVRQVQTDTYLRELERYGNDTMKASEQLFFHDSQAVVAFLSSPGRGDEVVRWQFAFGGVDRLLRDFRYALPDQARLLRGLQRRISRSLASHVNCGDR